MIGFFFKILDRLVPETKRGFIYAHIIIYTLLFSTAPIMMLFQVNQFLFTFVMISSMVFWMFPIFVLHEKLKGFNNQQESYRRKESNKNTVFYKIHKDDIWRSIYLNGSDGEGERNRKIWKNLQNDSFFKNNGEWEMGGPTDEWEKRQNREKRLKKILNK